MEFKEIIERAVQIRNKYAEHEKAEFGREWTKEEIAMGLVGDIGDLAQVVMAKSGIRKIDNVDESLKHELSDCLWSILVLANKYNIDMEKSFIEAMDKLEGRLKTLPK